jgi:hypothetical protein
VPSIECISAEGVLFELCSNTVVELDIESKLFAIPKKPNELANLSCKGQMVTSMILEKPGTTNTIE